MPRRENPALKVVAHLRDGSLVKGYTEAFPVKDMKSLLKKDPVVLPPEIVVRTSETRKSVKLTLSSLKALFFVKSLEGRKEYEEVKFFDGQPTIQGLWVRVRFHDGERTEGIVRNSLQFLVTSGFFLKPPDPSSNNEIVYVVKESLTEFQVLGVMSTY